MQTRLRLGTLIALVLLTTGCMPRIELDLVIPGDYEQTVEWENASDGE